MAKNLQRAGWQRKWECERWKLRGRVRRLVAGRFGVVFEEFTSSPLHGECENNGNGIGKGVLMIMMKISKSNNVWIMKPIGQSQGRGQWKRTNKVMAKSKEEARRGAIYYNAVGVGFSTITGGSHQQQCHVSMPSQYQQQSENCAAHNSTATTSSHQNQHVFHHHYQQQQQQNNATINICKETMSRKSTSTIHF